MTISAETVRRKLAEINARRATPAAAGIRFAMFRDAIFIDRQSVKAH